MLQSRGSFPDPHASLLTLSRSSTITGAGGGAPREAPDRWDCSDDDDEYVERLVIDVDAELYSQEYSDVSSASEDRGPSHLKEILQTGVYTGNYENVFKLYPPPGIPKEKKLKGKSEKNSKKERVALSADEIQKTLNLRADEYMRNNFMQYQAESAGNFTAESKALKCDICEHTFKFKSNLSRHKKHAHGDVKPYRCNVCYRRFQQYSGLLLHAKTHVDKPYACEQCQRRFAYKSNMTAHAKVHAGHKPYACDVCDARFTRKFTLTAHRRTHTGEKPYACHVCDRRYTNKTNLQNHVRTHERKVYVCGVCNCQFSRKFVLTRHEKTHAGTKSFACQLCGKLFTRNFGLKVHMRAHAGDKPFACTDCPSTFSCYQYLKLHKKRHQALKDYINTYK